MGALVSAALLAAMFTAAAAPDGGPRLRPFDGRLKAVLQEGMARSTTLKALVDRIEASDVIVYIGINPIIKSSLSGSLTWITRAGGFRYVRASISPDQSFD